MEWGIGNENKKERAETGATTIFPGVTWFKEH
jgi:hypothetical protein